jgi:hypothetical protein
MRRLGLPGMKFRGREGPNSEFSQFPRVRAGVDLIQLICTLKKKGLIPCSRSSTVLR